MDFGKIRTVASGLITAAGMGHAVATTDINSAARNLAQQWGVSTSQSIQDEINKEIRKQGGTTTSSR